MCADVKMIIFEPEQINLFQSPEVLEGFIPSQHTVLSVSHQLPNLESYVFSGFSRTWTWAPQGSCSCTPGTPGPMSFSASLVDSWSTGFLESGTRQNVDFFMLEYSKEEAVLYFYVLVTIETVLFCSFLLGLGPSSFPSLSVLDRWVHHEKYSENINVKINKKIPLCFIQPYKGNICNRSFD